MGREETKKRIPHMLLDTDFYEKPETHALIAKFGHAGPVVLQKICLVLMNEDGARLRRSIADQMHYSINLDQETWKEILDFCLEINWLSIDDDGFLYSERVQGEAKRVIRKRKTLSANAKQKQSKSKTKAKQNRSKSTDTDTDTDLDSNNNGEPPDWFIDESHIKLKSKHFQALLVNHYHGQEPELRKHIGEANSWLKRQGEYLEGDRAEGLMENWKRTAAQFSKGKSSEEKQTWTAAELLAE